MSDTDPNGPKPRSEAQRQAARDNGKKGRGPNTERGKKKSRKNAVTHGMRATLRVLGGEDKRALKARRDAWRREVGAEGEIEIYFTDRAVDASWMLDRGRKSEHAALQEGLRGAAEAHDRKIAGEVRAALDALPGDPGAALVLGRTAAGCRELAGLWKQLQSAIISRGHWPRAQWHLALALVGKRPADVLDDPACYQMFLQNVAAECGGAPDPAAVAARFRADAPRGVSSQEVGPHAGRVVADIGGGQEGFDALHELAGSKADGYAARAESLARGDRKARARAARAALVDLGPTAALRMRYSGMHQRDMHRNLKTAIDLRAARVGPAPKAEGWDGEGGGSDGTLLASWIAVAKVRQDNLDSEERATRAWAAARAALLAQDATAALAAADAIAGELGRPGSGDPNPARPGDLRVFESGDLRVAGSGGPGAEGGGRDRAEGVPLRGETTRPEHRPESAVSGSFAGGKAPNEPGASGAPDPSQLLMNVRLASSVPAAEGVSEPAPGPGPWVSPSTPSGGYGSTDVDPFGRDRAPNRPRPPA